MAELGERPESSKTLRGTCIGHLVQRWLAEGSPQARVQGCFRSACNVLTSEGHLITLLADGCPGPNRVIVLDLGSAMDRLCEGQAVSLAPQSVAVPNAGLCINLQHAAVWPGVTVPTAPLVGVHIRRANLMEALELGGHDGSEVSLAGLLPRVLSGRYDSPLSAFRRSEQAISPSRTATGVVTFGTKERGNRLKSRLQEVRVRDAARTSSDSAAAVAGTRHAHSFGLDQSLAAMANLRDALRRQSPGESLRHACSLVGLGPGLTPAGDDFLTGLFITLAYARRALGGRLDWTADLAGEVARFAAGRTTLVGEHQLKLAAAGEADEVLGRAAVTMLWSNRARRPIEALLTVGSTSGGDLLGGVCVACDVLDDLASRPR